MVGMKAATTAATTVVLSESCLAEHLDCMTAVRMAVKRAALKATTKVAS